MRYEFSDDAHNTQHASVSVPADGLRYDDDFMSEIARDDRLSRYSDFVVFRAEQIQPLFLAEITLQQSL